MELVRLFLVPWNESNEFHRTNPRSMELCSSFDGTSSIERVASNEEETRLLEPRKETYASDGTDVPSNEEQTRLFHRVSLVSSIASVCETRLFHRVSLAD